MIQSGQLVSHQKAKAGRIELSLKKGFRHFSFLLGVWPIDKAPSIIDARKELMNCGWFLADDIIEVFGVAKTDKLVDKIVKKYNINEIIKKQKKG